MTPRALLVLALVSACSGKQTLPAGPPPEYEPRPQIAPPASGEPQLELDAGAPASELAPRATGASPR